MRSNEHQGISDNVFVVTGGLGFVGSALCAELIRRGAREVRAFDVRNTSPFSRTLLAHGVRLLQGDVVSKVDVQKALRGADCVFHLASVGMSGKEMLQYGRVNEVNINGTCHVLDACIELGIQRLVYVSTHNVVFRGKEILNGNEALPYSPMNDSYSRSKSIAERMVLEMNGRLSKKNERCLYTCAIRPATVYGPGEEIHLPRIVSLAKLGLLLCRIGDDTVKSDWVYVDNLVLALILANKGLKDDTSGSGKNPVAAGQAYSISDGHPINTFEFLRPLLKSLDYDLPNCSVSVGYALLIGKFFAAFYAVLYPLLNQSWLPHPLILPAEVYKVGVTHYFSCDKAKEELGYTPAVSPKDGMSATMLYWQEKKRRELDGPTLVAWVLVVVGMTALFAAAYFPNIGPVRPLKAFALSVYGSIFAVRVAFLMSVAAHFLEGVYAWYLATKVDPRNAKGWFWQTTVLGFFSWRYLLKRSKKASK